MISATISFLAWPLMLFWFFLAYVTVMQAKEQGRYNDAHHVFKLAAMITVFLGGIIDVAFNLVVGTLVFWELPEIKNITFTHRCAKWMPDTGRRGKLARGICKNLGVFDPNHCKPRS